MTVALAIVQPGFYVDDVDDIGGKMQCWQLLTIFGANVVGCCLSVRSSEAGDAAARRRMPLSAGLWPPDDSDDFEEPPDSDHRDVYLRNSPDGHAAADGGDDGRLATNRHTSGGDDGRLATNRHTSGGDDGHLATNRHTDGSQRVPVTVIGDVTSAARHESCRSIASKGRRVSFTAERSGGGVGGGCVTQNGGFRRHIIGREQTSPSGDRKRNDIQRVLHSAEREPPAPFVVEVRALADRNDDDNCFPNEALRVDSEIAYNAGQLS